MQLLILVDYRNQFWLSARHKEANFDIKLLKSSFEEFGLSVDIKHFFDITFRETDYNNTFVIYQSSEDRNLYYKSFIEDILLGLKLKGAVLIPKFEYFRAHHNKVFMEILRDISECNDIKKINSRYYGAYEEYLKDLSRYERGAYVLKLSDGAQSRNVRLLNNSNEKLYVPRKLTLTFNFYDYMVNKIKPLLKRKYPNYRRRSDHRKKFIVQNFIKGLSGDYKILVFGEKYYVLSREVRKDDFRASGSGIFRFPKVAPEGLLNFAKILYNYFDSPFIALDIAQHEQSFYLLEFQFVSFGTYTLEKSKWYFREAQRGGWERFDETCVVEKEFAISVYDFIKKLMSNEK